MGQLEDMQVFVRIVEAGGIGRAADQLGIAKSAVSKRLSDLEERLGTSLIQRTTRRSNLTETGRSYYEQALKAIDYIAEINADVSQTQASLSGTLRLALPLSFGLLHLSPAINQFCEQHPELTIQTDFSDRQVELVEEGFDLAIRIAKLKDSTMQARKISTIKHVLVASPDYLERKGIPQTPEELKQHDILKYQGTTQSIWQITDPSGIEHQIKPESKMISNNGDFLERMAIAGHGITLLPTFLVWKSISTGGLKIVLPDCSIPSMNAYAVYSQNRFLPQRARAFIDFIHEKFGDSPYWDQYSENNM